MNGRVEQLNKAVRGIITLSMTAAFIYGFARGSVSDEIFVTIFAGIIGWWFAGATQNRRSADATPPNGQPVEVKP